MAAGIFTDLLGTTKAYFRIGLAGPRLKASGSDVIVRNGADGADANLTAAKVSVSGNVLELNSAAAGSGADWKMTLQRPTSGQSAAITLTLPPTAGTANQVLQTDGTGVTTWASAASTASCDKVDTTSLAFGTASPLALFSTGAADIITKVQVVVDTAFTPGTPTVSIGVSGTTSKYMSTGDLDLTVAGTYEVHPGVAAAGVEALIATYAASSASAGAARILVYFSTPA